MKFKKIKRCLMTEQDVIEIIIKNINKPSEIVYFRANEIYKLVYTKTRFDNYPVNTVFGYNAEGYNGIAVELRCLEEDK